MRQRWLPSVRFLTPAPLMMTFLAGVLAAPSLSVAHEGPHAGGTYKHESHKHDGPHSHQDGDEVVATVVVSGQGNAKFTWDQELTAAFPEAARPFEPGMHGGFNEDADTGIIYTGIPGYGLCSISPDLKTWTKLGDDDRLKDNVHGIVVFQHGGKKLIALAQEGAQRVLITDLKGQIVQAIERPKGTEFQFQEANDYYATENPRFNVTDITYLDGRLYAVTGYSPGDFVLALQMVDDQWQWGPIAWGGKGDKPGQFRTAHGISAYDDHLFVANREAHQVVKFTKDGKFVETFAGIPKNSRICNVTRFEDTFVLCPLAPVTDDQKSAPIYAYADGEVISTIIPADLGVPVIRHNHHVWPHYVTDEAGNKQLYLLVHGWNQGKYVVLKHETP